MQTNKQRAKCINLLLFHRSMIYQLILVISYNRYSVPDLEINLFHSNCANRQESHAVALKPRDAAVNSDRYRVCWHFAGAISVSRM